MLGAGSQKSISVRFNISRENEKRLYDEVKRHNRNIKDDPYGSEGAYIKAAVAHYMKKKDQTETISFSPEQLQDLMEQIVEKTCEAFLKKQDDNDQSRLEYLAKVIHTLQAGGGIVPGIMVNGNGDLGSGKETESGKSKVQEIIDRLDADTDVDLPDDALSYLDSLG